MQRKNGQPLHDDIFIRTRKCIRKYRTVFGDTQLMFPKYESLNGYICDWNIWTIPKKSPRYMVVISIIPNPDLIKFPILLNHFLAEIVCSIVDVKNAAFFFICLVVGWTLNLAVALREDMAMQFPCRRWTSRTADTKEGISYKVEWVEGRGQLWSENFFAYASKGRFLHFRLPLLPQNTIW